MNTMKWLLRREFWEHKGSIFWGQIVVGAVLLAFMGSALVYKGTAGGLGDRLVVNDQEISVRDLAHSIPEESRAHIAELAANLFMAPTAPLFAMLGVLAFFYCLGSLFDERRDRSILFWKSLPVSDTQTVLAKLLTAAMVMPLITLAVSVCASLLLLLIAGAVFAFNGVNLFGVVLSNPDFYLTPLRVVGLLPVYIVWALPTVGWLLMVSAWAKSKVFLWAVGIPLIVLLIVQWANYQLHLGIQMEWFTNNIIARALVGLFPGAWLPLSHVDLSLMLVDDHVSVARLFTESWMTLASPSAWFGAAAGAAMIVAAIRLRRWKDEG